MDTLNLYAALAEILGGTAILGGALFAIFQLREYRRRRSYQVAADLCREFTNPELARAVTLIRDLPDGVSLAELQSMDSKYQESAQIVGMTFETMGFLIHRNIASFDAVQSLTGGLLLSMWRKIEVWVHQTWEEQKNPRFGEWVQWLAERMQECEQDLKPAFVAYKDWNKHLT